MALFRSRHVASDQTHRSRDRQRLQRLLADIAAGLRLHGFDQLASFIDFFLAAITDSLDPIFRQGGDIADLFLGHFAQCLHDRRDDDEQEQRAEPDLQTAESG